MAATQMDEETFEKKVLENLFVLEAQYHRHNTWDDFVAKYRYLVEKEKIEFVVVDSLSMIESKERVGDAASPNRRASADNLSALKTYNHEKGVTCICIGQIKDSGEPVGGEALQHTADTVFLVEELSMGSKEMAEQWGSRYRDVIPVIRIKKSVTTPTFPHPVRVDRNPATGELIPHASQPAEFALFPLAK
jgi:hypothetical protein